MINKTPLACLLLLIFAVNCFAQSDDPVGFHRRGDSFPDGLQGTRIAMGDVDLDGDPDALVSGRLLLNDGQGQFRLAPKLGCNRRCRAAIFLDYDRDGDLDVFTSGPDRLLRNDLGTDGKARFTDVSAQVGIQDDGFPGEGLAAGDLNGDGYPDVYLANYEMGGLAHGTPDTLYLSNGQGGFFVSPQISSRACGRGVNMGDFDQDGDLDIYVSNYRLQGNLLYVNQLRETGTFSLRYENRGNSAVRAHTIGSAWGDLDGDGAIDLFMGNFSHRGPSWGPQPMVAVCRQVRPGFFGYTAGSELGIKWQEAHSNPTLFDLENDGDLDLYLTNTYGRRADLYRNKVVKTGQLRFKDATENLRAATYDGWGCATADVDNDGDQDLIVAVGGGRKPILLRNELAQRRPGLKSVRVQLRGRISEAYGVGATATLTNGTRRLVRQLSLGHGTSSQSEPILHFGVGRAAGPFELEIRWPSGHVTKTKVKPGQTLIREPKGAAPYRAPTGTTWPTWPNNEDRGR